MHRRNIIYTGIQIAWRLILGNIFLLISNLILCILSFNLKFTLLTSLVYLIASITIFPSLVALVSYLKNDEVGDKVSITYNRGGKINSVEITLGKNS